MVKNPAVKPQVATSGLVVASTVVLIAFALFLAFVARDLPLLLTLIIGGILLATGLMLAWFWWNRAARRRAWFTTAAEKWRLFNAAKRASGTTAEVTLLRVDAVQPTGSWVTIMWNQFQHVQPAWIEALPEPIWPGAVLLITPDPAQVMPGTPWPDAYFIRAADYLAWAPSEGRPTQAFPPAIHPGRNQASARHL
jgi:hypothetical protein